MFKGRTRLALHLGATVFEYKFEDFLIIFYIVRRNVFPYSFGDLLIILLVLSRKDHVFHA